MTRDSAKTQIGRLEALSYFPRTSGGIGELVDTLMNCTRDEAHAKATITAICDRFGSCPTPADIRRVAWELIAESEQGLSAGCEHCHGSGFVIVERDGISAADFCRCRPRPKPDHPAPKHQTGGFSKAGQVRIPGI